MTKIITIGQTEMIRVGRDYPCPICGKPDWCLVFADQTKAVCARKIDLDKPQFGSAGTIYDLDPKKAKDVTEELAEMRKLQRLKTDRASQLLSPAEQVAQ